MAARDAGSRTGRTEPSTGAPGGRSAAGRAAAEHARADELAALGVAFRRVLRALNRLRGRDTHLAGIEISHAQFQLLAELDERGEAAVGELAAAAQAAPGTVTRMLDGLVAGGHVQRVRAPSDGRVVVARLTASGRAELAAKRAAWQVRWDSALAGFGGAELAAATDVIERLAAMFDEASTAPGAARRAAPANSVRTGRKPV